MALRILKKFDELDIKEKILTGRRRNLPARHRKNQRPKSAVPTRRRNDNNGNRRRGRNANHGEKIKRRRPQSAGPVHRRGRSNNRNNNVPLSPTDRPQAPEVDNIFNSNSNNNNDNVDNIVNRNENSITNTNRVNSRNKRIRPASAGPSRRRIRSDRFNNNNNIQKKITYSSWNRSKLQRGKKFANSTGGKSVAGTSVANFAKRIINPEFYFLRVCLNGISDNYVDKKYNVQITDLTNIDRPSHWYTDLETADDGHLIFRKHSLNVKSKMPTRTVMSPMHDFYWVEHCTQLYGHAIRIEVYEQVSEFQSLLIDRCAYFGKFDPAIIAEANSLQRKIAAQRTTKKKRPTTAPISRSKNTFKSTAGRSPQRQIFKQSPKLLLKKNENKIERSSSGLMIKDNVKTISPRQPGGGQKQQQQQKQKKQKKIIAGNVYESKYNEEEMSYKEKQQRVRLQRDSSPRGQLDSPVGKLSGWNDGNYSPSPMNRKEKLDRENINNFRQHASQSPPPKLDIIAQRHPSPYLKKKKIPLSMKRRDLNDKSDLPPAFEVLKSYRKQIIEHMKHTQSETSNRRNRPTPPLLEAEGEAIMINLSPTRVNGNIRVGANGVEELPKKAKVVVPISKFLND